MLEFITFQERESEGGRENWIWTYVDFKADLKFTLRKHSDNEQLRKVVEAFHQEITKHALFLSLLQSD